MDIAAADFWLIVKTSRVINGLLVVAMVLNATALSMFIASLAFGKFPDIMKGSPTMFQDFIKYYACGKIALSDDRARAYEPAVQQKYLREIVQPISGGQFPEQYKYPVDYPPLVFPLMVPLAVLPLNLAVVAFSILSVGLAGFGIFVNRKSGIVDSFVWLVFITTSVLSWRTLAMGQMTWLVLGFIALYARTLLRHREMAVGFCLALAALKLQYALFLLVPLLVLRKWQSLLTFVGFVALLTGIAAAVMGPDLLASYPAVVGRIENADPYIASMTCLRGLAVNFLPPSFVGPITAAALILGLAATAYIWARSSVNELAMRWAFATTICIALLMSPHTHSYDSLFLLLAGALTITSIDPFRLGDITSMAERVWTITIMLFPVISWLLFKMPSNWLSGQVVAFCLLYALLAACAIKRFFEVNSAVTPVE